MSDLLNEMELAIYCNGSGWLAGSNDSAKVTATAKEWLDNQFSPLEAENYWKKGVFCPSSASQLRRKGISASQISVDTGYRFANGDISIDDVLETIGY